MKKIFFVVLFLIPVITFAQNYGNVWQFGYHAGIEFKACVASPLTSGRNAGFEGCASISDAYGHLLFYTNSDTVWNAAHHAMPNGHLVTDGGTISQVMIIPKPLSATIYYIITSQIQAQTGLQLQYHVIDMSLNSGLGGVVSKNNIITTTVVTEQLAATYHNNGSDIWLMAHQYPSNNFLCFLVTSAGISTTPVISGVGTPLAYCNSNMNARGEMKFSPDGSKIAINNNGSGDYPNSDVLSVCSFNNSTGVVSNAIDLPAERGGFGLSFSPDNNKLYGSTWKALNFYATENNTVFQFDMSSGNPATIIASKQIIFSVNELSGVFGAMKLGPDGKIYLARHNSTYLAVINDPDQPGTACNFVNDGFYLGGKTCQFGLNNYIEYHNYCLVTGTNLPDGNEDAINIAPNPSNGLINLSLDETFQNAQVEVLNSCGQLIFSKEIINSALTTLDITNYAKGIYFVKVQSGSGVVVKKVVVE